ncbi:MAG: HlyD family efflux transporter periplasmic adaptor subunit [Clostridium sp.]|jgi:multidrug efflux pump subunit AcrA (membrane-fusion protein)|nr:HlyD family efflux transporter periplasmic adaptor subunit [Clostridium sp.]
MNKKFFKKDEDLKYDFLPSAIEIIEKPASPLGKTIIIIISIFVISIIIWAMIAKIDVIVVSNGNIVPVDGIKVVDSNVNGEIVSINKGEGDIVKEGDEILILENVNGDFEEENIKSELELNKLKLEIINNKINNTLLDEIYKKYNIDSNKIEEIKLQENIEKSQREEEYNSYLDSLNKTEEQINEIKKEIDSDKEKYDKLKTETSTIISSYKDSILDDIKNKENQIKSLENEKEDYIKQRENSEQEYKLSMIEKRNQIEENIKSEENNLEALENNNSKYTIKSPVNGVILNANYNTVGSYINQSKSIAEIVSSDSELKIETYITNKDIARIEKGQKVVIKLEAYDYQKYGTLDGTIDYISPSAIVDKELGAVYKVKIKFDKNQNSNIDVLPGMTVTLETKSGKQRIIEYFLEPFKKNIDNALKG